MQSRIPWIYNGHLQYLMIKIEWPLYRNVFVKKKSEKTNQWGTEDSNTESYIILTVDRQALIEHYINLLLCHARVWICFIIL